MDRSNTIRMVTCMENGDVRVGNRRGGLFAYDCHLNLLQRNYYHLSVFALKEDGQRASMDGNPWEWIMYRR